MYIIPNKIQQSAICCIHCGKSYKNRGNLKNHEITCQLIYGKREDVELPTYCELFIMVKELTVKYIKLEKQVNECNNIIKNKKQKINIIDWLNSNKTPDFDLKKISTDIIIKREHIEILFNNTIYDTIKIIIKDIIETNLIDICLPLFAFNEKKNTIYEYNELSSCWEIINNDSLVRFFGSILIKLSKELDIWNKEKNPNINEDTKMQLFNKSKKKTVTPNMHNKTDLSKLINILYNIISIESKEIILYELDF
jgi:hypothetical protein